MAGPRLPNHWNLFNLRESPYFQDTLGEVGARYPLSLFVGRQTEVQRLLAGIGGASSSRHALGGAPGIGKTTLAQLVKATAVGNGYWATNDVLPFYPDDTPERVMGGVISGLYDAAITARPHTAAHPAMQHAQQYVRAFRLSSSGASVSVLGIGGGGSRSSSAVTPARGLLLDGPRLVVELLALAREAGAGGVVLHLNNLENLSDRDLANAADLLRSLRDPVFMQAGLHTILVGTSEAVTAAIAQHAQLRSVFTMTILEALPLTDLQKLLRARYEFLRDDPKTRVTSPVSADAVEALYPLFRGDLRGLIKALEEGVALLVGVVGTKPGASLALEELRPALQRRYEEQLALELSTKRVHQLSIWAKQLGPDATPTQDDLKRLWKLTQPGVSQGLKEMIAVGRVVALPRQGGEAKTYALSGASRLVFAD
jgi:hypothetical protein